MNTRHDTSPAAANAPAHSPPVAKMISTLSARPLEPGLSLAVFILTALVTLLALAWWAHRGQSRPERGDGSAVDFITMTIATVYVLLLALVVVFEWQYTDSLNSDVRTEAATLRQLTEVARRLPAADAAEVHAAADAYAHAVLDAEWPPPASGTAGGSTAAADALQQARAVLLTPKKLGDQVGNIEDQGLAAVDALEASRVDRVAVSRQTVPGLLIVALGLLSILTVVIPIALGLRLDVFTMVGMGAVVVTVLAALWLAIDLDDPYSGLVRASRQPLEDFLAGQAGAGAAAGTQ